MSLLLTLVAAFFVAYAMYTFHVRRQAIRRREDAGLNQVPTICNTPVLLYILPIIVQRGCPPQVPPILVASSQHLHIRTHTSARARTHTHTCMHACICTYKCLYTNQVVVPILIATSLVLSLIGVLVTNVSQMDVTPPKAPAELPELSAPSPSAFTMTEFTTQFTTRVRTGPRSA